MTASDYDTVSHSDSPSCVGMRDATGGEMQRGEGGRMVTDAAAPAVTFADVEAAARRIAGHAHVTPVITSRTLNERVGAELYLKCENLQRAGAFKFRGAFNRLSVLTP